MGEHSNKAFTHLQVPQEPYMCKNARQWGIEFDQPFLYPKCLRNNEALKDNELRRRSFLKPSVNLVKQNRHIYLLQLRITTLRCLTSYKIRWTMAHKAICSTILCYNLVLEHSLLLPCHPNTYAPHHSYIQQMMMIMHIMSCCSFKFASRIITDK
jgi:hypothetical protein